MRLAAQRNLPAPEDQSKQKSQEGEKKKNNEGGSKEWGEKKDK